MEVVFQNPEMSGLHFIIQEQNIQLNNVGIG